MRLAVDTATQPHAFQHLAAEWDALASGAVPRTPFQSSTWHRLWWKHFQRTGAKVRDELRLYTLRDPAGALVAVAPMMLTHRPGSLPIRTRELQFLGADSNVTEIRGLVCRDGCGTDVLDALAGHLAGQPEWDWVQWRGLPADGPLPGGGFRPRRHLQDFYLPLPASWDALKSGLPRNMKESLRKCYNSLARDGHIHDMQVIADPDAIRPALQRLLEMHAMRSELHGTVPHIDVFAAPEARAFIAEYIDEIASRGGVRLFVLRVAGRPVAMRIGFAYGEELYLYYSGYDPAWGRYSVMTTVVAEAIKWAIGQGYRRVNLSTGCDVSKTRWRPCHVEFVEGVQPSARWRGRIALAAMEAVRGSAWGIPFKGRGLSPDRDARRQGVPPASPDPGPPGGLQEPRRRPASPGGVPNAAPNAAWLA